MAIARGNCKPLKSESTTWSSSIESFAIVLSGRNRELMETIAREKPSSPVDLAEFAGRSK